jgi:hypothetical protein
MYAHVGYSQPKTPKPLLWKRPLQDCNDQAQEKQFKILRLKQKILSVRALDLHDGRLIPSEFT